MNSNCNSKPAVQIAQSFTKPSTSTFPSKWKTAKVTPIFKRNCSRDDKANYRPILVLLVLSKIFEKHIAQHLYNQLKDNELLHRLQSGFRKSFSTETALLRLIDQLFFDLVIRPQQRHRPCLCGL